MPSLDFYNRTTKRFNSLRAAKANGLFTSPALFDLPAEVGLDLANKRAVSKRLLQRKLRDGTLKPSDVYMGPGYVIAPKTKTILVDNKANRSRVSVETHKVNLGATLTQLQQHAAASLADDQIHVATSSFQDAAVQETLTTTGNFTDLMAYRNAMRRFVTERLEKRLATGGPFKVIFKLGAELDREDAEGNTVTAEHVFSSGGSYKKADGTVVDSAAPVVNELDVRQRYNGVFERIAAQLDAYVNKGSGWKLKQIVFLRIKIVKYAPFKGASYIELPAWLKAKQVCVNVQNTDDRCFEYAVLSALHCDEVTKKERVSCYSKYTGELNFDGIEFPVEASSDAFARFEQLNGIPINVFSIDVSGAPGVYRLEHTNSLAVAREPVNLLLVTAPDKSHYVWIRRLNGFVRTASNIELHCCSRCLQKFKTQSAYDNHTLKNKCQEYKAEALKVLPEEGKHTCAFINTHKQMPVPFVLYADCESMLLPTDIARGASTHVYQTHKAHNVGVRLVSRYPDLLADTYQQFDGDDCVDRFLAYVMETQDKALKLLKANVPLVMSAANEASFQAAVDCNLCGKALGDDRVRDHDHLTGAYRGACHSQCNINFNYKNFKLPVIFHNLRGYDSHLILQHAGKLGRRIDCIPNTMEKYLSFTIDRSVFLDSAQFTLASLEALVASLNKVGDEALFPIFNAEFSSCSSSLKRLLRQKGVFPYDWFDSAEKLTVGRLPAQADFYSQLGEEGIADADYTRAQAVWTEAGCASFYDYLSLYLKTDVTLLADVFEAFRVMCLTNYGLDPCHYFTAPGFSWDAMLKMTGAEIECFKDGELDMLQLVQSGMRGGISMISTRFAKANNPYLSTYDPAVESSYLMYLDANNLYGWAMSQSLPIGDYRWEDASDITPDLILDVAADAPRGFIFEVDLSVPDELHDYFNDYPLAPECTSFAPSPAMEALRSNIGGSSAQVDKLIPNLAPKTKYVLHYRNLQLYLRLGMRLGAVHRVLSFKQEPYLKAYIDFNTSKRAASTNDFEKDLFKLFNNAIFGKTCENVDKRIEVKLLTDPKKFVNYASRPYFKNYEIFSNDLVACEMRKTQVVYNRPMIVGMCILDISKVLMYDFHYNVMKARYGDRATLCFTDTDSLTYHIKTEDVYADMKADRELYDTSDYPKDHPLFSADNKKVIGKFKDELNGKAMMEFVGLRAKMYSILKDADHSKATAKGIKRNKIKTLTHDRYKAAIFGTSKDELCQKVSFNLIRSTNHVLTSIRLTKTGLCAYDDKRYVLPDNVHTLAHGHWRCQSA